MTNSSSERPTSENICKTCTNDLRVGCWPIFMNFFVIVCPMLYIAWTEYKITWVSVHAHVRPCVQHFLSHLPSTFPFPSASPSFYLPLPSPFTFPPPSLPFPLPLFLLPLSDLNSKEWHGDELTSPSPPHPCTFCPHSHHYFDENNCR